MAYKRPTAPQHYPDLPPSYEASEGLVTNATISTEAKEKNGPPSSPQYPGSPPATVVVRYVQAPSFGTQTARMTCPYCQYEIWTKTRNEGPGAMAWLWGGLLCLLGFGLCACIPCCMDSLSDVSHSCPNCKKFLGRYSGGR